MRAWLHWNLAVCFALAACSHKKPESTRAVMPPQTRVVEGVVVTGCDDPARQTTSTSTGAESAKSPSASTSSSGRALRTTERCVVSELALADVSGAHRIRFVYYDPNGNLYASTRSDWEVQASPSTGYNRSGNVRHQLPVAGEPAATLPGRWKVAVWLDGLTVSEKFFQLEGPGASDESPELEAARQMYRALDYEQALGALKRLNAATSEPVEKALTLWNLALVETALGHPQEASEALEQLVALEPAFSVEPESVRRDGGLELFQELERIRTARYPELYRKTIANPEVELSPAESAPVVTRRKAWYQRWWFYAGLGAVAIPVTAVLAKGDVTHDPDPPAVTLSVSSTKRDPESGLLCGGAVSVELGILGGKGPYDVVFTLATTRDADTIAVPGVNMQIGSAGAVVLRRNIHSEVSAEVHGFTIRGVGFEDFVRFRVLVKDSIASTSFDRAIVGLPLPESLADLAGRDKHVVMQETVEGLTGRCEQ